MVVYGIMTRYNRGEIGNTKWDLDFETGTLTIFGYGEMAECDEYELPDRVITISPWETDRPYIRAVVVEEGVTSISRDAFRGLLLMETVKIPDSVRSIGAGAFGDCASLRSVEIPKGVEEVEADCFTRCLALEEVKVSRDNPVYRSENGVLFRRDGTLVLYPQNKKDEKYRVPEGTKAVSLRAITGNQNLRELIFPEGFENLGPNAVMGCGNLERVEFPASLKTIGRLNSLPVREYSVAESNPNYKVENGALLTGDGKVLIAYPVKREDTVYEVPDGVEEIGPDAFRGAEHLKRVTMPATLERVRDFAFGSCRNLEVLRFDHEPEFDDFDDEDWSPFEGCGEIKLIYEN